MTDLKLKLSFYIDLDLTSLNDINGERGRKLRNSNRDATTMALM